MAYLHKDLALGRWRELTLKEQLGNIGSEVSRAARSQGKDAQRFEGAVRRALELFDLTLEDPRWRTRLREIARAREVFCDAVFGGKKYGSTLPRLVGYFDLFAVAARNSKEHASR